MPWAVSSRLSDDKLFLDTNTTSMLSSWFYLVYLIWYYYLSVKFVMSIVKQKIENKRIFFNKRTNNFSFPYLLLSIKSHMVYVSLGMEPIYTCSISTLYILVHFDVTADDTSLERVLLLANWLLYRFLHYSFWPNICCFLPPQYILAWSSLVEEYEEQYRPKL